MSIVGDLYRGESHIDFVSLSKKMLRVSVGLMLVGLVALVARGLDLGIEFEGGVVWEVPANGQVTDTELHDVLAEYGQDARVQLVTGGSDFWRVRAQSSDFEEQEAITQALAEAAGVSVNELGRTEVGPSWGDRVTGEAQKALIWFFVIIAAYIAIRFTWRMALAALIAVVHDILLSVGFYALFQIDITPATVIAFLTIMGYSLYDTLVVFDRVTENTIIAEKGRLTYDEMLNVSMNQVVMRSINTSITSTLPVITMLVVGAWIMGAGALQEFAVALLVGIIAGAYSSIFVAAPVLGILHNREPEWQRRVELAQRGATAGSITEARKALSASQYNRAAAPRPRKMGKKR